MIKNLQSILTQDNLATSDPVFVVYSKREIAADDYDHDKVIYVRGEDELDYEAFEELESAYLEATDYRNIPIDGNGNLIENKIPLDPFNDGEEFSPDDWDKKYIKLIDHFEQAFFIRENAQTFIKSQYHNLNEPYIFVESAHRNPEWQQIRKLLIDKAQIEGDNVSH